MNQQTVEEAIVDKLKSLLEISDWQVGMEEYLVEYGLNSLRTIQLVVELEQHFNITFEDDELMVNHFSTIRSIANQVIRKLNPD